MGIRDELLDRHRTFRNRSGGRLARAALVPVHDDKGFLQRRDYVRKGHFREARPTGQKKQDWFCAVLASNLNPLFNTAEADLFERRDPGGRNNFDSDGGRALNREAQQTQSDYTSNQPSRNSQQNQFHDSRLSDLSFQRAKITG